MENDMKHIKHYGKIRLFILIIFLLIVSIICFAISDESSNDYTEEDFTVNIEPQPKKEEQDLVEVKTVEVENEQFTDEEEYLLAKLAMAEAEGEDLKGKAFVMLVVLNRVNDDEFPDTIKEVIFQESDGTYQFSPIGDGRFFKQEPNDECYEALELVKTGYDESKGALYFTSIKEQSTWHSRNLDFLFEHGGHLFYK